jgi:hypothetical protein
LRGWWQFETYFSDHGAEIRQVFEFPALSAESERLADEIRSTNAVSVHVRRGDYVEHERLGFLDVAYYARAVEKIAASEREIELFVFSDDPEWCRTPVLLAERILSSGLP